MGILSSIEALIRSKMGMALKVEEREFHRQYSAEREARLAAAFKAFMESPDGAEIQQILDFLSSPDRLPRETGVPYLSKGERIIHPPRILPRGITTYDAQRHSKQMGVVMNDGGEIVLSMLNRKGGVESFTFFPDDKAAIAASMDGYRDAAAKLTAANLARLCVYGENGRSAFFDLASRLEHGENILAGNRAFTQKVTTRVQSILQHWTTLASQRKTELETIYAPALRMATELLDAVTVVEPGLLTGKATSTPRINEPHHIVDLKSKHGHLPIGVVHSITVGNGFIGIYIDHAAERARIIVDLDGKNKLTGKAVTSEAVAGLMDPKSPFRPLGEVWSTRFRPDNTTDLTLDETALVPGAQHEPDRGNLTRIVAYQMQRLLSDEVAKHRLGRHSEMLNEFRDGAAFEALVDVVNTDPEIRQMLGLRSPAAIYRKDSPGLVFGYIERLVANARVASPGVDQLIAERARSFRLEPVATHPTF